MRTHITIYITSLLLLLFGGCIEDNGIYNYNDLPELKVSGIPYRIVLSPEEEVELTPTLMGKDSSVVSNISCEWKIDGEVVSTDMQYKFIAKKICEHTLLLIVTDNNTNAKYTYDANIKIKSPYETGFLILHENNNNSELSFIRSKKIIGSYNPPVNDTLIYDQLYSNIYQASNNAICEGKPYKIREHWAMDDYNPLMGEITIQTEHNGQMKIEELNGLTFERETRIEQEFQNGELPDNYSPKDIIHGCWDSFLLDNEGYIYPRRSSVKEAYHTGYFSKDVRYRNGRKYKDMLFTFYPKVDAILVYEYNAKGTTDMAGIECESYSSRNNLIPLVVDVESQWKSHFYDLDYDILFQDYNIDFDADGAMAIAYKTKASSIYLHLFTMCTNRKVSVEIYDSKIIDLTATQGITQLKGMACSKRNGYTYYCDQRSLYSCSPTHYDITPVYEFTDKNIVSMALQSHLSYNAKIECHVAFSFDNGDFEIYEISNDDPNKLLNLVYKAEKPIYNVKQIIYKLGDTSNFFYF
ncbi:MAG: PKD-like family lipoprotein [Marinifilaceae bacterium]